MVAIATVTRSGSTGSVGKQFSPAAHGMSSGLAPQLSGSIRSRTKATKQEVAEVFLANLRARGDIHVDEEGFVEGIKEHFEGLPSRQAFLLSVLLYLGGFASFTAVFPS